ncbi:MAG: hypothetical protein CL878_07195 [Dehalococcoidia bacterium]|nr:hypothetical protein [Dehalococcoidia bacterium]
MQRLSVMLIIALGLVACNDDEAADLRIQLAVQSTQIAAMQVAAQTTPTPAPLPTETVPLRVQFSAQATAVAAMMASAQPAQQAGPRPLPTEVPTSPPGAENPRADTVSSAPFLDWLEPELTWIDEQLHQLDSALVEVSSRVQRQNLLHDFADTMFEASTAGRPGSDACSTHARSWEDWRRQVRKRDTPKAELALDCEMIMGGFRYLRRQAVIRLARYGTGMQLYYLAGQILPVDEADELQLVALEWRRSVEETVEGIRILHAQFKGDERRLPERQEQQQPAGDQRRVIESRR